MVKDINFGFLIGKWTVHNKRLKERLNNCEEWIEFQAEMETKSILNGLGLMDEMKTSYFGHDFVGLSIRIYNPSLNEWSIYWADTANPEEGIKKQVVGKFKDGVGEFHGKEYYKEKEVKVRFLWKNPSENSALWEQAYFDENKGEWETNWTMNFTRI